MFSLARVTIQITSEHRANLEHLEPQREKLGQSPAAPCVAFYQAAGHPDWAI